MAKDAKGHGSDRRGNAMPIAGHPFHTKSDAELRYIAKDAAAAAQATRGMTAFNPNSGKREDTEGKYLDQVNDAQTVLGYRQRGGSQVVSEDRQAASALANNHPKSAPVPVHPGTGRASPVDGQYFKAPGPDHHHSDYSEFGVHGRYGALNRGR